MGEMIPDEIVLPKAKTLRTRFCEAYKLFESAQKNPDLTYKEKETMWDYYRAIRDEWISHTTSCALVGYHDS